MPEIRRPAGYVTVNGQPYRVAKDPKSGAFQYQLSSTPKTQVVSRRMDATTGKTNIVEGIFRGIDGFSSTKLKNSRSSYVYSSENYHFALNVFSEREGEWIVLPTPRPIVPDAEATSGASFLNLLFKAPTVVWEQYDTSVSGDEDASIHPLNTYFCADHRAFSLQVETYSAPNGTTVPTGMPISLDEDFFFEGHTSPTGGCVFNNNFWCATGGGQRSTDRYIRKRSGSDGTWTNDDNNPLSITAVGSDGSGHARYTVSTAHGYAVNDVVFVTVATGATAHAGLWTITHVSDTTHFDVSADTNTSTMTGTVNVQDSDVQAEHLVIAGDLMYRSFWDSTDGWQVAAVDPIGSNPNLSADWTAGAGTLGVGDQNEPITGLIAVGDGVGILKADGFFIFSKSSLLYENEIPELDTHRHPENGKGAFLWKDWVYIPTVIGLLRWKNGIVQDVTPGRGQTTDYETPGTPIAYLTGDMTRLYAITKPYQINQPVNVEATVSKFGIDLTGSGVIDTSQSTHVFDGDDTTYATLTGLTTSGAFYIGFENQWHRAHLDFTTGFSQTTGSTNPTITELIPHFWNGSAWVEENLAFDGTMGWDSTDDDPHTLHQDGDLVVGMIDPSWTKGGDHGLDSTLYWRKYTVGNQNAQGTCKVYQVNIGIHSPEALEPLLTGEIQTDHGGTVFILSMTEEQGTGPLWRTMWAFDAPDVLYTASNFNFGLGGSQTAGALGVIQPNFLMSREDGSRHLFVGMGGISYVCPLGPRSDPTNVPYLQWDAWGVDPTDANNGSQYNVGPRIHAIVLPDADFGLPQHQKTLTEIEFDSYEGFDNSSCEVYYRVDRGAWVFVGFADDFSPDMPMVLPEGAEPQGKEFGFAIAWDGDASRPLRLPRIRDIRARVMPRPEMSEMLQFSVELDPEQTEPGFIDRRSAHNRYEDLKLLTTLGPSVAVTTLDGATRYGNVLEINQKSNFNSDGMPKLVAEIFMALTTPEVLDS